MNKEKGSRGDLIVFWLGNVSWESCLESWILMLPFCRVSSTIPGKSPAAKGQNLERRLGSGLQKGCCNHSYQKLFVLCG